MKYKIFLIIFLFFFFPFINADIISLNSGGNENLAITGSHIEGFFLGSVCGDGVCNANEDCSSCPADCGICETPVSPGGGRGSSTPSVNIELVPENINLNLIVNTAVDKIIKIKNLGSSTAILEVNQENLDNLTIFNKENIEIKAGETKDFHIRFVAPNNPGIFTGKIKIGNKEVLVSLNVRTKLLLFDSNITVLNRNYRVFQGDKLKTEINLSPKGDPARMDVTLNYIIKDYNNKTYLTHSETLLIKDEINFKRDFDTGNLPVGKYVVGLELIYSNGIAPSSAHFEVVEKPAVYTYGKFVFYLITLILLISILIIILLIIRKNKEKNMENK